MVSNKEQALPHVDRDVSPAGIIQKHQVTQRPAARIRTMQIIQ